MSQFNINELNTIANKSAKSFSDYFAARNASERSNGEKIYMKTINPSLFLIYNNYDARISNSSGKNNLFNECRSIVIEIDSETDSVKIVSYTSDNIRRDNLDKFSLRQGDVIFKSYEGTLVNVFFASNSWHICTSRCIDIDKSYFYDKGYTFGRMFDECTGTSRDEFMNLLDRNKCYNFVILHHKNRHIVDYTEEFGEDYTELILVSMRSRETQEFIDFDHSSSEGIFQLETIRVPITYSITEYETLDNLIRNHDESPSFSGVTVYRPNPDNPLRRELIKINSPSFSSKLRLAPNHSNIWDVYTDLYFECGRDAIENFRQERNISKKYEIEYDGSSCEVILSNMYSCLIKNIAYTFLNALHHFTGVPNPEISLYHGSTDPGTQGSAATEDKKSVFEKLHTDEFKNDFDSPVFHIFKHRLSKFQYLMGKGIVLTEFQMVRTIKNDNSPKEFYFIVKAMSELIKMKKFKIVSKNDVFHLMVDAFLKFYEEDKNKNPFEVN